MLSQNFIWLALVITLCGNAFYIKDTLQGNTQPNRVSMLLWGAAPLVAYFSQRTAGVGVQAFYTLLIAIIPLLILAASFVDKKAYWAITKFDVMCGLLSATALVFLVVTKDALVALLLSIAADWFAGMPTLIKSYKHPESETSITYVLESIGSTITLLTIKHLIFVDYSFAAYVLLTNLLFAGLLLYPRKKLA